MSSLLRTRAALQASEVGHLAFFATLSTAASRRRPASTGEDDYRLAFQRDRDRILHARAFRRLKHKTQVFVPHVGDHPRNRLTHTLEVAQLGRTIARALGLNEDLTEAIALGHDLGHTAFGHTGELVLDEILNGNNPDIRLSAQVAAEAGSFKHNYQSLRVVDLLEHRYSHPGLNLTDQVREGILKHTSWRPDFEFPLPDSDGLFLEGPCHLEGQVVAAADEIAQQTHDLEDGLRAGSVALEAVEKLAIIEEVIAGLGNVYRDQPSRGRRQNLLIRGLIHNLVSDVLTATGASLERFLGAQGVTDRQAFAKCCRDLGPTTVWFSAEVAPRFRELKDFIYKFIINHPQVNRQDWRARKVVSVLFRAFWDNPLNLPSYVLLRAVDELGFGYLRDLPRPEVAAEVRSGYHSSPGFARLVADHIAGMSDRFALEEYCSLEQPSLGQRFTGGLR